MDVAQIVRLKRRLLEQLVRAAAGLEEEGPVAEEQAREVAERFQLVSEDQGRLAWVCTRNRPGRDVVLAGLRFIVGTTPDAATFHAEALLPGPEDRERIEEGLLPLVASGAQGADPRHQIVSILIGEEEGPSVQ